MSGDERKTERRRRSRKRRSASRERREAPSSAAAPKPRHGLDALTHQRRMALSATITAFGVAWVGMGDSTVGSVAVLAGLLGFVWTIHTFGRLGPESSLGTGTLAAALLVATSLLTSAAADAQPADAPPPLQPPPAGPNPGWETPAPPAGDDAQPPSDAPPSDDAEQPAPKPKRRRTRRPAPYGYAPPPGYGDPRYPAYGYPPYGYPPYGYPPYGYGAPTRPAPVRPYRDGEPPPDGYHLGTRIRRGMVIGGATTFGSCWVLSIAVGAALQSRSDPDPQGNFLPLIIPIAGPFVTIGTSDSSGVGTAVLLLDGVGQALGLGLFVAGLIEPEKVWLLDDSSAARLRLVPQLGQGVAGVSLLGEM